MTLGGSYDACVCVDELGPDATGELAVLDDGGPRGAVFVEGGRVCWAAARGLSRRLTELLGGQAGLPPAAMEALFVECKMRGAPLGEHLLDRGVLGADALREALLQHTLESLGALWQRDVSVVWSPRAERSYSARFTFATSELLSELGARAHPRIACSLHQEISDLFGDDGWGAAFVRAESCAAPVPVALVGRDPPLAKALMRVGKWAASALDLAAAFSGDAPLISVDRGSAPGQMLVALRLDAAVIAGETDAHGPARILNRRSRARRMESA